jgi:hypothetical protein
VRLAAVVVFAACWNAPESTVPVQQNTPPPQPPPDALARVVVKAWPGIDLVESDNHAIHTHGGPPATLAAVTVRLAVRDRRPHKVALAKLQLLEGHCNDTAWTQRTTLGIGTHEIYGVGTPSRGSVTLPGDPDTYTVKVAIDNPPDVYNACDRFAFAITVEVDGVPADVVIPLHVEREEP